MRASVRALSRLVPLIALVAACGPPSAPEPAAGTAGLPGVPAPPPQDVRPTYEVAEVVQAILDAQAPERTPFVPLAGGAGLTFRLSEALPQATPRGERAATSTSTLSDDDTAALLARLPELKAAGEAKDFAFRAASLKPPLSGSDVMTPFPPAEELAPPTTAIAQITQEPLRVLRYLPEGAVDLAPKLSISFSQPMVPLTSLDVVDAARVPVKLTPTPPGTWSWLDPRTLQYVPEARFPMATQYVATVKKGTKSANDNALAEELSWRFETPPPRLQSWGPGGEGVRLDPVMYLVFDQAVDPAAVLATVKVTAGGKTFATKPAPTERLAEIPSGYATGSQVVHFVTAQKLPRDAQIDVVVGPGTPSAEGPLKTAAEQRFSFRTYGPLRVRETRCRNWECYPGQASGVEVWFTNAIDDESLAKDRIVVKPAMADAFNEATGEYLSLEGTTEPNTTYSVTLPDGIKDIYGQKLTGSRSFTFRTQDLPAYPGLAPSGDFMQVLDPNGPRAFNVLSMNQAGLRVRMYAVSPSDYEAYRSFASDFHGYEVDVRRAATPPGRQVLDQVISPRGKRNEAVTTRLDLSPALDEGYGHVVLLVEPTEEPKEEYYYYRQALSAWIQSTQLGLAVSADEEGAAAWVSELRDGTSVGGAEVSLAGSAWGSQQALKTDASGLAVVDGQGPALIARRGKDSVFLPQDRWTVWAREKEQLLWFVFDDRNLYRPTENVHVKGWIRTMDLRKGGDLAVVPEAWRRLSYHAADPQGNEIAKGSVTLNDLGGFDLAFDLPDGANLGWGSIELVLEGAPDDLYSRSYYHSFRVEEFRRPEFEVSVSAPPGPHVVGGHAIASVTAAYFSGGPLPDAETAWYAVANPSSYVPPNRGDFQFGAAYPWWWYYYNYAQDTYQSLEARTDAHGLHQLRLDFDAVDPRRPMTVHLEGSVTDVNRQRWTASSQVLVHPSELYLGMRATRGFVQPGDPIEIDTIVANIGGDLVPGTQVALRGMLVEWVREEGQWLQVEVEPQTCHATAAANIVRCVFQASRGGFFIVRGDVTDAQGRGNTSELAVWVAGGEGPPNQQVEREEVILLTDKSEYAPGDTAEILVNTPWYPAEGLVTLMRSGIVQRERVALTGPSTTLKVPITDAHVPGLGVQVDLAGSAVRFGKDGNPDESLPKRPAFASGRTQLSVPPGTRTLTVQPVPRHELAAPGSDTAIDVYVFDHTGAPVADAEVAVVVVDEAILMLAGHSYPDPIAQFYVGRSDDAVFAELREMLLLEDPTLLSNDPMPPPMAQAAMPMKSMEYMEVESSALGLSGVGMGGGGSGSGSGLGAPSAKKGASRNGKDSGADSEPQGLQARTNFTPLALFEPAARTDAQGHAAVPFKLPDNLTRYRVLAVAAASDRFFGKGESTVTARLDMMLRPSPPRFLNFGDTLQLPIVVQNLTDQPMPVRVAVRGLNLDLPGPNGLAFEVPPLDRAEVFFPAVTVKPGKARIQVAAVTGDLGDAAELALPVWTPATSEAFAVYGELDDGAIVQPIVTPPNANTAFGGLEVSTASTALHALTDAVLYLVEYPFECSEQLASRLLGVVSLRDVLAAFEAPGLPSGPELTEAVARDLERLRQRQNWNGGFGYWTSGEPVPYVSIHVAHALYRTRAKGFAVPDEMTAMALEYLRDIQANLRDWESRLGFPLSEESRAGLEAYALYVRALMADDAGPEAARLLQRLGLDKLSLEADAWLLAAMVRSSGYDDEVQQILRHLGNRVEETAGAANFVSGYSDGAYVMLHSNRRSDAVILDALITATPDDPLVAKVVRGLLGHRRKGRWTNTQENAFVLVALEQYFAIYEATTPDFVARVWLGDAYAGEQTYKGRSTERQHLEIPMAVVAEGAAEKPLVLQKEGAGRLYYRVGMRYAPNDLTLDPLDRGFVVERQYEAVDDPGDVTRDADGVWHVKSGATVRVKLSMLTTSRRYHVALVDWMPAGFEALNPTLATTGSLEYGAASGADDDPEWWRRYWFEHQNLRDERVEAFTSLLWDGSYTYAYVARATTPGSYVVPPAKAEEMYSPETFGRSSTLRVVVE